MPDLEIPGTGTGTLQGGRRDGRPELLPGAWYRAPGTGRPAGRPAMNYGIQANMTEFQKGY